MSPHLVGLQMKITRIIAIGLAVSSIAIGALQAQSLRDGSTPAEFPPSSFTGKQYVDSKGCVYVRAGIDGNVTWVPRVTRERKLVCGFKPSLSNPQTATVAPPAAKSQPEQITIAPPAAKPAAAPKPAAQAKPKTTAVKTTPQRTTKDPIPTTAGAGVAAPKTTTARTAPKPAAPSPSPGPNTFKSTAPKPAATAPQPAPKQGKCPGASALSQKYINDGSRFPVRCGPQPERPVTLPGESLSSLDEGGVPVVDLGNNRVVERHIYEKRINTTDLGVPSGFRPAWDDDRLNEDRAERTLAPARIAAAAVPNGFRPAWDDERLNPARGQVTPAGEQATDQIWKRRLPRTLAPQPVDRPVVTVSTKDAQKQAAPTATVSTKSVRQPVPETTKPRYIRVAAFADKSQARAAAQGLARQGLTVRLGTSQRGGKSTPIVLAGPYPTNTSAEAALSSVKRAGFANARVIR